MDDDTKLAKGSLLMFLGSFIFRIGGFLYRFITASLLGPAGYGIFALAIPIIGVMQLSANGGIPTAITKYIAQYDAVDNIDMIKQIIRTSSKLILLMGILFSIIIYILAEPLALGFFHNPDAILPFKSIALITPFSVLFGEFNGIFIGFYKMNFVNVNKAFEQSFTIIFATLLILANFYVAGAVIGTAIGYMVSTLAAFILFRKYIVPKLNERQNKINRKNMGETENIGEKFTLRGELNLVRTLFFFSIPVLITGVAELFIYDSGTWVIGYFLPSQFVGYYGIASPIARIPLMISMAIATAVLPATSAALSTNNHDLVETFVNQAFRYVAILVLPISLGIAVLASPLLSLLFPSYVLGTQALQILSLGMLFFTIYTVSASVLQGIGKPVIPMIVLVLGVTIELGLSYVLVPIYGISGASIATTVTTFVLMVTVGWQTLKNVKANLEFGNLGKIAIASVLMAIVLFFIPTNYAYTAHYINIPFAQILALIYILIITFIGAFIYIAILTSIGGVKKSDVDALLKLGSRLGPLAPLINRVGVFFMKYAK